MDQDETWLLAEKYHGVKTEGFFTDRARLEQGEPLAYVIGHVPFLNTTIHLDSRPLIPRAETEYWVEKVLKELALHPRGQTPPMKLLDLCAGSGCIGIAALAALPLATVDLVELDSTHHPTIEKNVEVNHITPARVKILGGDLFENVIDSYDAILTNPPYIDPHHDRSEESVRAHEPHLALYGGTDGMVLIERILRGALPHLNERGILVMEHEPEQAEEIHRIAKEAGLSAVTHKDQYGTLRYTVLARSAS